MTAYRVTLPADSGLYEACARHSARMTARSLQVIYLCDSCTQRLVSEAFNDRAPVYHGESIPGFCGLCNQHTVVTMRQWFVCSICWNVVLAYQKSIAASAAVHRWWKENVTATHGNLQLEETEPVFLAPFARSGKTKKQGAASIEVLDFLVSDGSTQPAAPVFHIEQKTGPGSIDDMSEFQLDVNDFNDIAGASRNTGLPTYVVHVQAVKEYEFPTHRTVIGGLWWADLFELRAHMKKVRARRGEDKKAIYFEPSAFKSIDLFVDELKSQRYLELASRLLSDPLQLID